MTLTVVREEAPDYDALDREAWRLQDLIRNADDGRWVEGDDGKWGLMPDERRAEIDARLAEIERIVRPHRIKLRREEFPRRASKAQYPSRLVDAVMGEIDTNGQYFTAVPDFFSDEQRSVHILVCAGNPGTGKSVGATWHALQEHMRGGGLPRFLTAASYFRMGRYGDGGNERERVLESSALILDDLGAEYLDAKGSALVDFDELIDAFYSRQHKLIITTNIRFTTPEHRAKHKAPATEPTFLERYGARVTDRLRHCGKWILDTGPSKRRPL